MYRKIASLIGGLILAALLLGGTASADDAPPPYPAPAVAGTSQSVAAVSPASPAANPANAAGANIEVQGATQSLSYTGAGFEVGTAIAIGSAIVLAGLVLVLVGSRRTFGSAKKAHQ